VLGNGKSRGRLDLKAVAKDCLTIGCNVLLREYEPDYLVSSDHRVFQEWDRIVARGLGMKTTFISWAKYDQVIKHCHVVQPIVFRPIDEKGHLSGIQATMLAMYMGCDPVFLAGFDQDGSSVYAGTRLYERAALHYVDKQAEWLQNSLRKLKEKYNLPIPKLYQLPPFTLRQVAEEHEVPMRWRKHETASGE
jgi:hypothetical protein